MNLKHLKLLAKCMYKYKKVLISIINNHNNKFIMQNTYYIIIILFLFLILKINIYQLYLLFVLQS